MEKKSKYAKLVNTITSSLYAVLILNVLSIALLNISIFTGKIPAGSSLLFTDIGPGIIPVESFVLVEQTGNLKLLDCVAKDKDLIGETECNVLRSMGGMLPFVLPQSIGSGTIVGHKENSTYILTAAHVCLDSNSPGGSGNSTEIVMEFPTHTLTVEYTPQVIIHDYAGGEHNSTVAAFNVIADTCIVETSGVWGLAVPIAQNEPPPGTTVQNMAAPLGIWAPGMTLRLDGFYAGIDAHNSQKYSIYTIPVAGGSSGSPVLYNGEIISIIVMSHRGFSHMGIGVRLEEIQKIMSEI